MSENVPNNASQPPLWSASEATQTVGGALKGGGGWAARGLAIDSREVKPGDLFVALKGAESDGHRYVKAALDKGASAVLSAHNATQLRAKPFAQEDLSDDAPLIVVPDTLKALRALGVAARARPEDVTAIGVTGSVGKTSTKEMLARMFSAQVDGAGRTHSPVKSFNNHVGVPLTLARTPRDTRYGIYEMGMNAPGEIADLTSLVRPDVAIVTAVEPVHLAGFKDGIDGVAAAKAEIFKGLEPGGVAIVRRDAFTEFLSDKAREAGARHVLDFGEDAISARITNLEIFGQLTLVDAQLHGHTVRFEIGAPGRHFAMNALAGLLAVLAVGGDVDAAAASMREWSAVSGRGDRIRVRARKGGAFLLIDESYNANPASMRASIETFAAAQLGQRADGSVGERHLFLTDMLELGLDAERLHAELAEAPGMNLVDKVHAAGPLMRTLLNHLPQEQRGEWAADAEVLAKRAPDMLEAGDAAMVKGSLGSRANVIAKALRELGTI